MEPFHKHVHLQRKPTEWALGTWWFMVINGTASKMVHPESAGVRSMEEVGRAIKSKYQESYHVFLALSRKKPFLTWEFTEQTRQYRSQSNHPVVQVNYSRNFDPLFMQFPFCPHLPSASTQHESSSPVNLLQLSPPIWSLYTLSVGHMDRTAVTGQVEAEKSRVWGQPALHGKTLSQTIKTKQKCRYPFVQTYWQ